MIWRTRRWDQRLASRAGTPWNRLVGQRCCLSHSANLCNSTDWPAVTQATALDNPNLNQRAVLLRRWHLMRSTECSQQCERIAMRNAPVRFRNGERCGKFKCQRDAKRFYRKKHATHFVARGVMFAWSRNTRRGFSPGISRTMVVLAFMTMHVNTNIRSFASVDMIDMRMMPATAKNAVYQHRQQCDENNKPHTHSTIFPVETFDRRGFRIRPW